MSALALVRQALPNGGAWLVGGAVRDELLGRGPVPDLDLVVAGDPEQAARAVARAAGGAAVFELSEAWGAWRVVARDWQVDVSPLHGDSIEQDLRRRDFTLNAMARDLADPEQLIDPLDGAADLARGTLRLAAPNALAADPLRALRLVRLHCELGLQPDKPARAAAAHAQLDAVAPERKFEELMRVMRSERVVEGWRMLIELDLSRWVLPELDTLGGVEQSHFHHLDVQEHTLEVLRCAALLEHDPEPAIGAEHAEAVRELLATPLTGQLTRGTALRFGALLHDIAKPQTKVNMPNGRIGFPGHDRLGAAVAKAVLARLRAGERLARHAAALTEGHLRLGFLVHHAPLDRRQIYGYLAASEPVAVDVTLLSCADRLATRGAKADQAIERHLALARAVIGPALEWQLVGRPQPLLRGDELAAAAGLAPGPRLGEVLAALEQAQYAGELETREQAIEYARGLIT